MYKTFIMVYIAHRRETSNALNASVRCEQKRLQRLSETVPANNRITQVVRQGIPDQQSPDDFHYTRRNE